LIPLPLIMSLNRLSCTHVNYRKLRATMGEQVG